MRHQQTISRDFELEGRGLFTGEPVSMRLRPSDPNTGVTFILTDQSPPVAIEALVSNVSKRSRRTALKNGTVAIETVEHCLGACSGLGLDNLRIELKGKELPGFDGSGITFVEGLRRAGILEQAADCVPHIINEPVRVVDGDSELVALPPLDPDSESLEIAYDLDYGTGNPIGRQFHRVVVTPETFEANIAPARTFVLEKEAEALRSNGLGHHLSYQDVLVIGKDGPIENRFRFPDECVRHKILDLIGDVSLVGRPIIGRVFARKSGHALNHELARALHAQYETRRRTYVSQRSSGADIQQIRRVLPHRYPFLLVDRIVEVVGSQRVVGLKNVTINEPFFQGHYPGDPIMPGVLIIEALAQVGGVLLSQELEHKGRVAVLLSLDKVKFRRPVRPGDQLILEAEAVRVRSLSGHVRGRALVGDDVVAEADIKFILTDAEAH